MHIKKTTIVKPKFREKLKHWMVTKISFRLHMSFIMLSTVFMGMISSLILLNIVGIISPVVRYPLTVLISYGWFFIFIRTYIRNILLGSTSEVNLDLPNNLNVLGDISDNGHAAETWEGSGGTFSGAGASESWDSEASTSTVSSVMSIKSAGASDIKSEGFDIGDGEGGVVLIVGGIFLALTFGAAIYLIWYSPEIFSECLLQVILVSGMRRNMKKFSEEEWIIHIFKNTVAPFILILCTSFILGMTLKITCPNANNLTDYKMKCWNNNKSLK